MIYVARKSGRRFERLDRSNDVETWLKPLDRDGPVRVIPTANVGKSYKRAPEETQEVAPGDEGIVGSSAAITEALEPASPPTSEEHDRFLVRHEQWMQRVDEAIAQLRALGQTPGASAGTSAHTAAEPASPASARASFYEAHPVLTTLAIVLAALVVSAGLIWLAVGT